MRGAALPLRDEVPDEHDFIAGQEQHLLMSSAATELSCHRHEDINLGLVPRRRFHWRSVSCARITRESGRVALDQDLRVTDHDDQIGDALALLGVAQSVRPREPHAIRETLAQSVRRDDALIEWACDAAQDERPIDARRKRRYGVAPCASSRTARIKQGTQREDERNGNHTRERPRGRNHDREERCDRGSGTDRERKAEPTLGDDALG
jgi:hypothetical protein